jgi:hypothetical protein
MTLPSRIEAILAQARAAARPADGPARLLDGATGNARVAAILAEIGEVVLPRALSFSGTDGSRITIEARGRRLAKITAAEGAPALTGWEVALAGAEADPAAEVAQMARMIAAFAAAAGAVSVIVAPSTLPASFVRPGHPTDALARAIGSLDDAAGAAAGTAPGAAPAEPPRPAPGAAGLFAALDAAGHAAARADAADGRVTRVEHDAAGQAVRLAPAAARLARTAAPFGDAALPGPRLVFLTDREGRLPVLCHAPDGGDAVTGTPTAGAIDALAEAWRRVRPADRAAE